MTEDRLARLLGLGLPEAQARAYLALLDHGPASASEVARRSRVARNRVYDALDGLASKGLADVELHDVRMYRPRPAGEFLERRRLMLASRRVALVAERAALKAAFREAGRGGAHDAPGGLSLVRGRRKATDAIVRRLAAAARRVDAWTSVATLVRLLNHADGCEALPALGARPQVVRVLAGGARADDPRAAELRDALGDRLRLVAASPPVHRFAFDAREACLLAPVPDDERVYVGDDVLLVADGPAVVRDTIAMSSAAWRSAAR